MSNETHIVAYTEMISKLKKLVNSEWKFLVSNFLSLLTFLLLNIKRQLKL